MEQMVKQFTNQLVKISGTQNLLLSDTNKSTELAYKYDEKNELFILLKKMNFIYIDM